MENLLTVRNRFPRKELLVNRLLIQLLLLVAGILLLTGCEAPTNNLTTDSDFMEMGESVVKPTDSNIPEMEETVVKPTDSDIPEMGEPVVETAFELHLDDYGICRVDVRIPNLNNNLPNADQMNEIINSEYRYIMGWENIEDVETSEGYEYVWHQYDYVVADFDGVYSIAIYSTASSAYGSYYPYNDVRSFYYDSKNGEILTASQFLEKVGYSEDAIINAYINSCCPAYTSEQIDFSNIYFYFNEHNELNFFFNSMSIVLP